MGAWNDLAFETAAERYRAARPTWQAQPIGRFPEFALNEIELETWPVRGALGVRLQLISRPHELWARGGRCMP